MTDDWFVEPEPPGPARKHAAYTKRLVAWGWLTSYGAASWEIGSVGAFTELLKRTYLPSVLEALNRPMFLGGDSWVFNPEAPVT